MNQKVLAINILMLLQRKNLNLKELAIALNLEPKYLKNKIYKMLKGNNLDPMSRTIKKRV